MSDFRSGGNFIMTTYEKFLASKTIADKPSGFEPSEITAPLFEFQKDIVRWAVRRGRAAIFEDCGLGKTIQELEWSRQVAGKTNGMVLHVSPLAVSRQIMDEAAKFGYEVTAAPYQTSCQQGINVTNFEKLHRFDGTKFDAVVIDESSILKSFDGKTRTLITEMFAKTAYKLAATATPAPNDHMELANHAEFLGIMSRTEMLATFFVHDSGKTQDWRLKGHSRDVFWKWLCSWATNITSPADLGYDASAFVLPPLNVIEVIVDSDHQMDGYLVPMPASSLQERRQARRGSMKERVDAIAELFNVKHKDEQFMVWCDLNDESEAVSRAVNGAREVAGKHDDEYRADALHGFISGKYRGLISKGDIFGFGMNLQHCHLVAYCGVSDSWEKFYQSLRRFYRFGQKNPVTAYVVLSKQECAVLENLKRKEKEAAEMTKEMARFMADIQKKEILQSARQTITYNPQIKMEIPKWM